MSGKVEAWGRGWLLDLFLWVVLASGAAVGASFLGAPVERALLVTQLLALGAFIGTRSPDSKSVMFGALGALLIWSAVFFALWQFRLWTLDLERERQRASNQERWEVSDQWNTVREIERALNQ